MIADRVSLFPTARENEAFAFALVEICREHPFRRLEVFQADPCPLPFFERKPGFVVEAQIEGETKWRRTVWFTRKQFTVENVERSLREIVWEWKNFYLKSPRN